MPLVVLVILAALWAVVLAPPLLRARTERSGDSIGEFNYRLGVLGRAHDTGPQPVVRLTGPVRPGAPRTTRMTPMTPAQRSAKRRRDILTGLAAAVGVTFVLASVLGGSAWWGMQVLADALLVTYVGLIAYFRSLQAERLEKVRYLPQPVAPHLALRRTASS